MRNLINVQIPDPHFFSLKEKLWSIQIDENDHILSLNPMQSEISEIGEDWAGDWLSPRGIDLQINGGLGLAFTDLDFKQLPKLNEFLNLLWRDGIEAISPTLVSCSIESLRRSLAVIQLARKETCINRSKLLGAHLEGPFLSMNYQGAHNHNHFCLPSLSALDKRINGFEREIALVTMAPELPGSSEVIKRLNDLGILVSLGHSSANSNICRSSFDLGISMITHAFNAMPGLHHRDPGPVGEAISHGQISMGLIADGIHVHPNMVIILQKLARDSLFLVSDALSPYGLEAKQYQWDQRLVFIDEGVCRLDDGTLAGTTLSLLEGCKRLAKWTKDPSFAIWAATVSPRHVLEKGKGIKEFFVGHSLEKFLRWNLNFDSYSLNWKSAK
ncbi:MULTISPECIES: N-acetylglucosamine-6-phosphate deacetylase [unclassified Prochlorococcus]|uniref:N-acetylglucosamine-6-phosphate deacetylase n=1 Tax=unclassified Prochlorococcus TaxID=2627481 RepID=UPI000533B9B3|nr:MULTISPECIES: N-acetylglucosamine-6-phosphate deacetylase [unclassified Prochlorococcus]KGG16770.1 N-acetylglucosamine-6-phosphate deacetylase [Prochlorococcus sp. MIT 0602]KGG18256.1 N-acetylglucosamine-6-phosphate deacetylase [Prochlorococcus sp. MIT 0603]